MKKIINNTTNVVSEMIDGITSSSENLLKLKGSYNVVVRSDFEEIKNEKVVLLSGGGAGHEPSHFGFIGKSMLTAAVSGDVFASPSSKQIFKMIKSVAGKKGCLLIVKNYMGDKGNFKIAKEMCATELPDIRVEMIIVDDDISAIIMNYNKLIQTPSSSTNKEIKEMFKSVNSRRGIAGTVLVHKILGGLADQGYTIDQLIEFYNENLSPSKSLKLSTIGIALSSCTIPSIGTPSFSIGENEMELGLGIHGEHGIEKVELKPSKLIVKSLIDKLLLILSVTEDSSDKSLIVMINNLGSTTNMETGIIANDTLNYLNIEKGYKVKRLISGTLMTSLEMAGISITLLSIKDNDDTIIKLIDYNTNAYGWPTNSVLKPYNLENKENSILSLGDDDDGDSERYEHLKAIKVSKEYSKVIYNMVLLGCNALIDNSKIITELDSNVGDGDCGITLENLSKSIKNSIDSIPFDEPCYGFRKLSNIITETIGGSSGLFYTIFFIRLSNSLYEQLKNQKQQELTPLIWGNALLESVNAIKELGQSDIGDCTMLDSLIPAINQIYNDCSISDDNFDLMKTLESASDKARLGSESTINMVAKKGRSSYLGERSLNFMDPGAFAISIVFKSFLEYFKQ